MQLLFSIRHSDLSCFVLRFCCCFKKKLPWIFLLSALFCFRIFLLFGLTIVANGPNGAILYMSYEALLDYVSPGIMA